jgi:hypothetical protein
MKLFCKIRNVDTCRSFETVKNGISKGYNNNVISDLTGLINEQIDQIRKFI